MNIHKISTRYLDKCMRTIEENCNDCGIFCGDSLEDFCSNDKNLHAIRLLEAMHEIKTFTTDMKPFPDSIFLLDDGVLHFYVKREKMVSGIKGFVLGVLSAFIANTLLPYLFNLLL